MLPQSHGKGMALRCGRAFTRLDQRAQGGVRNCEPPGRACCGAGTAAQQAVRPLSYLSSPRFRAFATASVLLCTCSFS